MSVGKELPSSAEEGWRDSQRAAAPGWCWSINMMRRQTHNLKSIEDKRKELRSGLTPAEAKLWRCLQRSQISGKKFRRQHSVGPYILDFYCAECSLAVELDGDAHFTESGCEADLVRTEFLRKKGICVVRFENRRIFDDLEFVLAEIERNLIS
jgi:very-short-patch-repair endonuclease